MRSRSTLLAGALLVSVGLTSGCGSLVPRLIGLEAPVIPPGGFLFTQVEAPLQPTLTNQDLGSKVGSATTRYILIPFFWLSFEFGDMSVQEAAQNGNITKVKHVDYRLLQVLGVYAEVETIVYGD